MATQHQRMQRIIRHYKDETGAKEVDMREVAQWAVKHGWKPPQPVSPIDRLAREFARAARDEVKNDPETGLPYRVNHAVTSAKDGKQLVFWVDIDEAPRPHMQKSLIQRREQMIGDGYQLTLDAEHWNRVNPKEEPIQIPLDFTDDIEERKNAPRGNEEAV